MVWLREMHTPCGPLQHPHGFMMKFYALSELVTPVLSWGFLGTNPVMAGRCHRFKVRASRLVHGLVLT